jgi:hypothetical protein
VSLDPASRHAAQRSALTAELVGYTSIASSDFALYCRAGWQKSCKDPLCLERSGRAVCLSWDNL